MGMIAGIGKSAVGHILRNHRESAFDEVYSFDGVAERALLGEASLATVIKLGPAKCRTLGIFDRMLPIVFKLQPTCRRVGPMIMPFVMEPAWRATGGELTLPQKPNGEADVEPKRIPTSDDTNTTGFGPRLNANAEAFINALTESLTSQDTEAFTNTEFGWGDIFKTAIRVAGPILASVLEMGLTRLEGGDKTGSETGVDASPEAVVNNPETSLYTYDAMTQRAIAAEASLEALLQTPVESLQQEGIWGAFKQALKNNSAVLGHGTTVLTGAMSTAAAAMNLASAHKLADATDPKPAEPKKKGKIQADEAAQEQKDGGETA